MADDSDRTVIRPVDKAARADHQAPVSPTVVRPTPGKLPNWSQQEEQAAGYTPQPMRQSAASAIHNIPNVAGGQNQLIEAAANLFALVGQLSNLVQVSDAVDFHARVTDEMKRFRLELDRMPLDGQTRSQASYALCTLVDTSVLNSPLGSSQGGDPVWSHSNMLRLFHPDEAARGGEDFFGMLEALERLPERNIELLEFFYVALSLGLRGQYGLSERGTDDLTARRQHTDDVIRRVRGPLEPALSPHWQGLPPLRNRIVEYLPLWVVAAVAGLLLMSLFAVFWLTLENRTSPVFERLARFEEKPIVLATVGPPTGSQQPIKTIVDEPTIDLRTLLKDDIAAGNVGLDDDDPRAVVTIQGDGLFRSGRSQVKARFKAVIARIAGALNQVPGRILVVGHSDNLKPRVGKPSNWVLSRARAKAVSELMVPLIDAPMRVEIDGKADTQPLVPNTSRANRAKNRRVEISLFRG